MRHPTLIFCTKLMRTINTAHPEYSGSHTEGSRIVQHVLVGNPFRTAIWTMKIKIPKFTYSVLPRLFLFGRISCFLHLQPHIFKISVNLIRRGEDDRWSVF